MLLSFIATCFIFDLYPGASFLIVALNSIQFRFSRSIFTAFGVAVNDGLSSLFSLLIFGFIKNEKTIIVIQIVSLAYLFFESVRAIFSKSDTSKTSVNRSSSTGLSCFRDGFLISFLNPHIAIGNTAILTQFTLGRDFYTKAFYHTLLFLISLLCFLVISAVFSKIRDTDFISNKKNLEIIKKLFSSFIIIFVIYKVYTLSISII